MYKLVVEDIEKFKEQTSPLYNKVKPDSYTTLRQHSRPIIDSIFGENMRPVRVVVSIRTDLSNEIVCFEDDKFYAECLWEYPNEHPLDDTVMLGAKKVIENTLACDLEKVIPFTHFYPVGACVVDDKVYAYVNIILHHEIKEYGRLKLRNGAHLMSIESIVPHNELEIVLKDSLVIVKGGAENA